VIGETRVLFDGVPGPMYYAITGKASAFAPFGLAGKSTTQVQVEYRGVKSPPLSMVLAPALPGLITADSSGAGQGAILNADNSINNG
jgi:uncharacterized protein (TIGR03437 family)